MTRFYFKVDVAKTKKATYFPGQTDYSGLSLDGKKIDISPIKSTLTVNSIISVELDEKMNVDYSTFQHHPGGIRKFYKQISKGKYTLHKVVSEGSSIFDRVQAIKAPSDGSFYIDSSKWQLLVRNILTHTNTMLIGPTGCGKTSIVKIVCETLGIPLHIFDMGACTDPISTLLGVHRLKDGKSIFDYAKFTKVIQEPCVILLDELSRSSIGSNNILFPCLDDRRTLNVDIAGSDDIREIKVHPDVTFISTANIGSEYTGTNTMDAALVDRFLPIELGNISQYEEGRVLIKRTKIDSSTSDLIVKVATTIRNLAKKGDISKSISIRETLMIASLIHDGWKLETALKLILLPLYEGTDMEGERSLIYKTIATY